MQTVLKGLNKDERRLIYSKLGYVEWVVMMLAYGIHINPNGARIANECAEYGYIEILESLSSIIILDGLFWAKAMENHHYDMVELVHRTYPINGDTYSYIISKGNLGLLATCCGLYGPHPCISIEAVKHEQFSILKWARENRLIHLDQSMKLGPIAAEKGNLEMLQWIIQHEIIYRWTDIAHNAAKNGHLHILQWIPEVRRYFKAKDYRAIAFRGHLHILQWFGNFIDSQILCGAAGGGHLHIIQWAIEQNIPRNDPMICANAAKHGHLSTLQWLIAHDFPFDIWSYACAAENGHLDIIRWIHTNTALAWDWRTCAYAAKYGHLAVLEYCQGPINKIAWKYAEKNGHAHVIEWLYKNKSR